MSVIIEKYSIEDIKKNEKYLKQLKQLSRKTTGEQLKIFDGDTIVIALYNSKIIGTCCIAMRSPETHFKNEFDNKVPYLYNYVCDITHKKKKPSVSIMLYIKDFVKDLIASETSTNDILNEINLDVEITNDRAINFFEKNNFIPQGLYQQSVKEYKMYTCVL